MTTKTLLIVCAAAMSCGHESPKPATHEGTTPPPVQAASPAGTASDPVMATAARMIAEGRATFRNDTFGDEAFWGGTLKLHQAIAGQANGGIGDGMSPKAALALGLKVDVAALPADVVNALRNGKVDLANPATTLVLLKANAVVGVTGFFDSAGKLSSIGIQCAFCHSTVDDSLSPGMGARLDGWPNRDLNVGAIIALAPDLSAFTQLLGVNDATVRKVLAAWGPGKFDAELVVDGKGFRPDGQTAAALIPPAYGLAGIDGHTYTGWGSIPYWNSFVANLEMHGQGTFFDPRLDNAAKFPVAAENRLGHVRAQTDRITAKLPALHFYQLALLPPRAPEGSFDRAAAERGQALFNGKAKCATCHVPPIFTEPGWNRHTAAEIGIDDFQAARSPDGRYRTTPLRGAWARSRGGYYHDGRFATLDDVVAHYDPVLRLGLTPEERRDLVEYVKSL